MQPRLGVNLLQSDPTSWLDDCRRVEALGFHELSVADHLVAGSKSPFVALSAAAAVTERMTLSTMVLNNVLRHPGELAAEAAMLQALSGGRFVLGMGSGYAQTEHDAIGMPLPPVAQRLDRLEEAVAALRVLLRGEALTVAGDHYAFTDHQVWPVPSPAVPILVGGGSPRLIEIAGRHADIVGFTGFSVTAGGTSLSHFSTAGVQDRWERVQAAAGARAPELRFQALVQAVRFAPDREQAAAGLAQEWSDGGEPITASQMLDCPFVLLGTVADMVTHLREGFDRWGIETWTTFVGRPADPPLEAVAELAQALG